MSFQSLVRSIATEFIIRRPSVGSISKATMRSLSRFTIILATVIFAGCQDVKVQYIATPRYLTQTNIRLNAKEIEVKKNKNTAVSPEVKRMLGLPPMEFLEEWIDTKMDPVGTEGTVEISFPSFEINEKSAVLYTGFLRAKLRFLDSSSKTKEINIVVNVSKGFAKNTSYQKRKGLLYDLVQELIADAHESILMELRKINQ